MAKLGEFKLGIKPVSIFGRQHPSTQALKFRMIDDHLDQPFAQSAAAVFEQDKNVANVSECRLVGDHARKPYLLITVIQAEADRVLDRCFGLFDRASIRPIRFLREEFMNDRQIEEVLVGTDREFAFVDIGHFAATSQSGQKLAYLPLISKNNNTLFREAFKLRQQP